MATAAAEEGHPGINGVTYEPLAKKLTDLPTELLEHILCFPVLKDVDICNVSCCCKRLHDVCHGRGKVWGHQYKIRCYDLLRVILSREGVGGGVSVEKSKKLHKRHLGAHSPLYTATQSAAPSTVNVSRWHFADAPGLNPHASGTGELCVKTKNTCSQFITARPI